MIVEWLGAETALCIAYAAMPALAWARAWLIRIEPDEET